MPTALTQPSGPIPTAEPSPADSALPTAPASAPVPSAPASAAPTAPASAEPSDTPAPTPSLPSPSLPSPGTPSSATLIADALATGELTSEQATIYRAFAAFDDPRLPPEYRGDDGGVPDANSWSLDYASLSAQGQALLRPFTLRPDVDGSWYYTTPAGDQAATPNVRPAAYTADRLPGAWLNVTGQKVRVLYTKERLAARAQQVLSEAEVVIWPKLLGLLGVVPKPDCTFICGDRGGNPLFDIYLVDKSHAFRSYVAPEGPCDGVSSYMVLNASESFGTLAHEMMHAFQNTFPLAGPDPCNEYRWFKEATAQWAMDYVYGRKYNSEEQVAFDYLDDPTKSLNVRDDKREYGAYVFFFYLTRVASSPSLIRSILQQAAHEFDSLKAIDAAIPGGLKERFPEFARYSWNPDWKPLDQYRTLDALTQRAEPDGLLPRQITGTSEFKALPKAKVDYSASVYFEYDLDPQSATVLFLNGWTFKLSKKDVGAGLQSFVTDELGANSTARKYGRVQALVKREGQDWAIEDWTNTPSALLCQDDPHPVEKLVVILTNSDPNRSDPPIQPQGMDPGFWVSNMGCYQWKGTSTFLSEDPDLDDHGQRHVAAVRLQTSPMGQPFTGGGTAGPSGMASPSHRLPGR